LERNGSGAANLNLEGFETALLRQHEERRLALKRTVDEDLADIIAARRLEVENIVHSLRRSREERLEEDLKENRRRAELRKKAYLSELERAFLETLEDALCSRVEILRRSPRYKDVMKGLALEAAEGFPFPSVALVESGDAACLASCGAACPGIVEIRENLRDKWGGLVLVEAGKERGRFLDNTLRTRWERLRPVFAAKAREKIHA
jgi:vacuolar-type H+-ATPase subunit E/Vma4